MTHADDGPPTDDPGDEFPSFWDAIPVELAQTPAPEPFPQPRKPAEDAQPVTLSVEQSDVG